MTARLPTHLRVGALLRRVNDAGGFAVLRARGDAEAGGILMLVEAAGERVRCLEPAGAMLPGGPALIDSTPADDVEDYWRRRRARDPDLWVVELNVAGAERFIAETIASN